MKRNRQNYQCDVLLLNDGTDAPNATIPAANVDQIHRVQDGNWSMNVTKEDVNQWGQGARLGTVVTAAPDVTADFTYYMSNMKNEVALGFNLSSGLTESFTKNLLSLDAANPILNGTRDGRNFYMLTADEGKDANLGAFQENSGVTVIGFGKAYLTDYSIEASVGSIPQASFSIVAANQRSEVLTVPANQIIEVTNPYADDAGQATTKTSIDVTGGAGTTLVPFVDDASATLPYALRSGDIVLTLGDSAVFCETQDGATENGAHIQSFSMNIDLTRTSIERIGNNFSFSEEIEFPINVTVNISAIVANLKEGSVYDQICNDNKHDLAITFNAPCGGPEVAHYLIKGCELESESYSQSIGSNKTVDLTFTSQIGGPDDTSAGVFVRGEVS